MANLRLATRCRSDRDGGSPRDERNWLGRVRVLPPRRKVHGLIEVATKCILITGKA